MIRNKPSDPQQDPTATVERTLASTRTVVRLVLQPMGGSTVRINEYYRRRHNESRFSRIPGEEGLEVAFDRLHIDRSFHEVFDSPASQAEIARLAAVPPADPAPVEAAPVEADLVEADTVEADTVEAEPVEREVVADAAD